MKSIRDEEKLQNSMHKRTWLVIKQVQVIDSNGLFNGMLMRPIGHVGKPATLMAKENIITSKRYPSQKYALCNKIYLYSHLEVTRTVNRKIAIGEFL